MFHGVYVVLFLECDAKGRLILIFRQAGGLTRDLNEVFLDVVELVASDQLRAHVLRLPIYFDHGRTHRWLQECAVV